MFPGFSSVVASVCVATAMDFFRRKMKVAIVCLLSASLALSLVITLITEQVTPDDNISDIHTSASKRSIRRFVITEKAPTRAFSWLKAATRYIHSIFVPPSQSNDIAKKSAYKAKRGHESTTGIHLIDE